MRLHDLVEAYIDYKRSLGMRYRSEAVVLRSYYRAIGDIAVEEIRAESVLAFIAGTGPVTTRYGLKFRILRTFYHYALGRGLAASSPLPSSIPKPFIPSMN